MIDIHYKIPEKKLKECIIKMLDNCSCINKTDVNKTKLTISKYISFEDLLHELPFFIRDLLSQK